MIKECNFSMGMILFIYCRQYFFEDAFKTFWPTGSKSFNVKLFPLARKFRFTSIQITFLLSIRVFPFQGTQWFRLNYIVKQSKTALDRWHSARHLIFFSINNLILMNSLQSVDMNRRPLLNWKSAYQLQISYWTFFIMTEY